LSLDQHFFDFGHLFVQLSAGISHSFRLRLAFQTFVERGDLGTNIANLVDRVMRLGHAVANFEGQGELLLQVLLCDLYAGISLDLERRGIRLALDRELDLVRPGQRHRTIGVAGPERRARNAAGAFVTKVPDKAVQAGFCWQRTLRWTAESFIVTRRLFSRLTLRRIFANHLAFAVEDLQRDGRGRGPRSRRTRRGGGSRGWCGFAARRLFAAAARLRFLDGRFESVINDCARRRILPNGATASPKPA